MTRSSVLVDNPVTNCLLEVDYASPKFPWGMIGESPNEALEAQHLTCARALGRSTQMFAGRLGLQSAVE